MKIKKNNIKTTFFYKKDIIQLNQNEQIFLNNTKLQLLSNYDELINILKFLNNNNKDIFLFLYNNKEKVHNILYDSEKIIDINSFELKNVKDIAPYFYLSLLIMENPEIVNYSYSLQFIKDIFQQLLNLPDDKKIKQIIISKIILDFINNFEGFGDYEEDNEIEILKKIKNKCFLIIKDNLYILKDLNLNLSFDDVKEKKIDEIYSEIIIEIIKNKDFTNFEYILDIIKQIDLENIYLNKEIYDKLINCLDIKNNYIIKYIIEKKDDILNKEKINFYYILLKYVIKISIYFYQMFIFLKTRKFLLNHIKGNNLLNDPIDKDINLKLNYITRILLDSEYYAHNNNKIRKKISLQLQLREVLKYYREFLFESKINEINALEDILKNNKQEYKDFLNDYQLAKKMNCRVPIINYLYFEKTQKKGKKSEIEFSKCAKNWETLEDMVQKKRFKKMTNIDKKILIKSFVDENMREVLLKIFNQELIDYFINQNKKLLQKIKNIKEDIKEKEKKEEKPINEKENIIAFNYKQEKSIIIEKNEIINKTNNQNLFNIKNKDDLNNNSLNQKKNDNIFKNNSLNSYNNSNIDKSGKTKNDGNMLPFPLPKNKDTDNGILDKILNKSSFKFLIDENKHISIYDIFYGDSKIKISINQFETNFGKYINKICEKAIEKNAQKFYIFIKDFSDRLISEFKNNFKFNIDLNFQNEEESKNSDNIFNISCKYIFYQPYTNNPISFIDDNILINGTYSNSNGFEFLIIEINNDVYKDINEKDKEIQKYSKSSIKKSTVYNSKKDNNDNYKINYNPKKEIEALNKKTLIKDSFMVFNDLNSVADEVKILEVIKIVEKENKYNGFLKELERGYYIICKSDNSLNLYDIYFNHILNIKAFNQPIFNVYERINEDKIIDKDKIYIIVCTHDDINLIIIDLNTFNYTIKANYTKNQYFLNYIEMKKTNCIALGLNGVTNYFNLFNDNNNIIENKLFDESYFSCIKINDNIIALASNSILPRGQDQLIFYNVKSKKISNTINDYSFIISPNGFSLIERKEENKKKVKSKKILICACKKYHSYQKNGILLINVDFSDSKHIKEPFINTDDIEIYSICPIKIVENNNEDKNYDKIDQNYKKNIIIKDTDYFLVGGFDTEKRSGIVKLYKLIFSDEVINIKIEFIQDIEFNKNEKIEFEGFSTPINSIFQSKITGNIIISSYDGKIILLTKANLDYYFKEKNFDIIING